MLKLESWKFVRESTILVYGICDSPELKTEFTAKDQLKRAALSSMHNIAEGFDRFSNKECIRFLNISTASIDEVHGMALLYAEMNFIYLDQGKNAIEISEENKISPQAQYLNTKL